jgi:hypothetical protein
VKNRHQRDGGGEGQAAGGQAEPVFAEALAQRARRRQPGKAREVGEQLAQIHRPL